MLLKKILPLLLLITSLSANASDTFFIIAPHCLIKHIPAHTDYQILSTTPSLAFIKTSNLQPFIEAKQLRTKKPCGGFMNVTDSAFLKKTNTALSSLKTTPHYSIRYSAYVNPLLNQIHAEDIWADLTAFSDTHQFKDRYANSSTGVKAALWLQHKILTIADENHRDDVTVYTVATGRYKQPSVVVKIGDSNLPGIVIGAHMDTLQHSFFGSVKPGADDDGSGSMTVMGIARTLLASGMHFKKPIYIIWYAAEELGLVGSNYVAHHFANNKIPVEAVLQFDMTGYAYKNDTTLWLISDYVSPELNTYLATLIHTYVKKPVNMTECGYACSDHASWMEMGIPSAFPFEAAFGHDNPEIHTSHDTIGLLSLSHITDFTKLGVAFAVELGEPL